MIMFLFYRLHMGDGHLDGNKSNITRIYRVLIDIGRKIKK